MSPPDTPPPPARKRGAGETAGEAIDDDECNIVTASCESAAHRFAEGGWHVFPLKAAAKTPAVKDWPTVATTDLVQIDRWWLRWPDANVGIACGPSGLVVIDVDAKTLSANGWTAWLWLVNDRAPHGLETPTYEVGTPTGGGHLSYAAPEGVAIRNSAGTLAANVDVRADGGYVVAPPSATPEGVYTVDSDEPVAVLPHWLKRLLRPAPAPQPRPAPTPRARGRGYAQTVLRAECQAIRLAPVGTRNDTLNRAAFNVGTLAATRAIDAHHAVADLYLAACDAGLSEVEAVATIRSGIKAGLDRPRGAA